MKNEFCIYYFTNKHGVSKRCKFYGDFSRRRCDEWLRSLYVNYLSRAIKNGYVLNVVWFFADEEHRESYQNDSLKDYLHTFVYDDLTTE